VFTKTPNLIRGLPIAPAAVLDQGDWYTSHRGSIYLIRWLRWRHLANCTWPAIVEAAKKSRAAVQAAVVLAQNCEMTRKPRDIRATAILSWA
jgi:hypothetical protein